MMAFSSLSRIVGRACAAWPATPALVLLAAVTVILHPRTSAQAQYYRSYAEIGQILLDAETDYPDMCKRYDLGLSVQGRHVWALRISDNVATEEDEPGFKYISTMHGNEIVGNEMCLYLIDYLISNYGSISRVTNIVDSVELWIVPLMNPDGYVRTQRENAHGVRYRDVMSNFLVEIERCIRLGVEYDLFWNLDNLELTGYREIVTIRKDGKVEVARNGETSVLESARIPERPDGHPPQLSVEIGATRKKAPSTVTARARVTEGSAPVYYTQGAGKDGIYRNTYVLWELYGPEDEDYTDFWNDRWDVLVSENGESATVEIGFRISKPGTYRLRVSTSDAAGRSKVVWKALDITE